MAVKSAYKKHKAEIPAAPEIKTEGPEPDVTAMRIESDPEDESLEVAAAITTDSEADDAAVALRRQIEALRASEQLQRNAAIAAQQPPTREQKLAYWRSQGTSEAEIKFLEQNPELIDIPELTAAAAAEALQQGHKRGTEAHMHSTRELFHRHLEAMRTQAEPSTPAFFAPTPEPEHSKPSPASFTSAPVSREIPSASGMRIQSPSRMTLTPDELLIAKASGISATEYAKNKLRLAREKASGERQ